MHPTTVIELAWIFGAALGIALLAFLFTKKVRKVVWSISCFILITGLIFYGTRPFIVQHQTKEAIEELEKHLKEIYPEDAWRITDTDEHEIQSVVNLHVIFESEPKIIYKYTVVDTTIEQVDIWMVSGYPVEGSGIEPQHYERK